MCLAADKAKTLEVTKGVGALAGRRVSVVSVEVGVLEGKPKDDVTPSVQLELREAP